MTISKKSLLALTAMAVVLAGCSTSRFGNNGGGQPPQVVMPGPAGSGTVTQSTLPPPAASFPAAPNSGGDMEQTQVASLEPPSNASDLTPASVAGVWKASVGGMSCQIATPQTKFGQGYRAGPLHCPAAFTGVSSWAVNGKQLSFYDASGSSVATLYSTGASRFEGRTTSGQTVVLSR
ncbi:AprI/Inh family metalloprotease inhibitor [Bartonella sp. LJL80]